MEPKGLISFSREPNAGSYPESHACILHSQIQWFSSVLSKLSDYCKTQAFFGTLRKPLTLFLYLVLIVHHG